MCYCYWNTFGKSSFVTEGTLAIKWMLQQTKSRLLPWLTSLEGGWPEIVVCLATNTRILWHFLSFPSLIFYRNKNPLFQYIPSVFFILKAKVSRALLTFLSSSILKKCKATFHNINVSFLTVLFGETKTFMHSNADTNNNWTYHET